MTKIASTRRLGTHTTGRTCFPLAGRTGEGARRNDNSYEAGFKADQYLSWGSTPGPLTCSSLRKTVMAAWGSKQARAASCRPITSASVSAFLRAHQGCG